MVMVQRLRSRHVWYIATAIGVQCHRARKLPHAERHGPLTLCVTRCDDFDLSMSTAEYGGSSGENASGGLNRTDCTEAVGCASGSRRALGLVTCVAARGAAGSAARGSRAPPCRRRRRRRAAWA